ncbi:TPA: hypothetical protein N0F65_011759 [Lagenidium giganteum]|uniref:Integrase catalytic domain-containing protein n=1 Tax=Lagenidium giganteum TaxID=4803 RepID=A0AAV2YPZ5_9STRA|nr:TPA: hypothetical protein N0F65_011759 [Lagenidium giganteum]
MKWRAITIIDTTTRLVEIQPVMDGTSLEAARIVDQHWFAKYPRPARCLHDQGSEFKKEFRELLSKRVHLSIGNKMRTTTIKSPEDWGLFLVNVTFALRATYLSMLQATHEQIAFGRGMLVNLKHHTDWEAEHQRKVRQIKQHNERSNRSRTKRTYTPDCKVFVRNDAGPQSKLVCNLKRAFEVIVIRDNGPLTLHKGRYVERVHMRRVRLLKIRNGGEYHA